MSAVIIDVGRGAAEPRTEREPIMTWTRAWFVLVTLVLVTGWFLPLDRYLSPRQGIGYWLGIIGGSMMLLLLVYPLRKRLPAFSVLGNARIWFQVHMALGVLGPMFIVYHCLYRLGATNSNVALICMLIVSGSGVMGRYLYARIHHGLYGSKATVDDLRRQASNLKIDGSGAGRLLPGALLLSQ